MYLDLDPERFATPGARASEVRSLIDAAHRAAERDDALSHEDRVALRASIDRIDQFLADPPTEGARSLAIFCSGRDELFEVIKLGRPVAARYVIGRRPYVAPLVGLASHWRWMVALVNRSTARFFIGDRDRLVERSNLESDVHGQHDQGGWSQARYARSVARDVDDHLRGVADTIRRSFRAGLFDRYVLGGPSEAVARLDRMLDEADVRAGLIEHHIDIDVEHSNDDQVTERTAPLIAGEQRGRERAALDRMAAGVGSGGHGTGGPADTIEALNERRAEVLLLASPGAADAVGMGFERDGGRCPACGLLLLAASGGCPVDGTPLEAVELREAAIEAAIAQDAEVVLVSDYPDLGPFEGIGAVLRF